MTLVLDASMAVAWFYAREKPAEAACADRVLDALAQATALVPCLWYTEVANALLVGERRNIITKAQAIDFLAKLGRLPIEIDDAIPSARQDQVMAFAREYGLTAYDATYFELALRKDAVLATFDAAMGGAMSRAGGALFGKP